MSDRIVTLTPANLPYQHPNSVGSGGRIRDQPGDFMVEEEPLYLPSGEGEHLYLWIEKENASTNSAVRHLLRRLGLPPLAAGFAGRKDTRALTRQWLSFHTPHTPAPQDLDGEGVRVLSVSRHGNKLRKGHLAGNRFTIVIRGIDPEFDPAPALERITREGFPNYFGMQRMGAKGENPLEGKTLLTRGGGRHMGGERARFAINAYQSAFFNDLVATRLTEMGDLTTIQVGDLALLHRNRAVFPVTEEILDETLERAHQGELSASALLPGYQAPLAEGIPGEWERNLMLRERINPELFRQGAKRHSPKGERRAVRTVPSHLAWETFEHQGERNLRLTFLLTRGTYATSLLREVMRNDTLPGFLEVSAGDTAHA